MLDWLPALVCVGLLVNGVRLRGRLRRLDTLPASGRPVDPEHAFLAARGVRLSEAARRAASNHASRERLDVLDLVPIDLTIERALDVARMIDTRTYRSNRAALGRGAFQALLVRREVLERAGIVCREDFDPVELVEVTERLKRYACATTDLAVVPGLRSSRDEGAKRVKVQMRAYRWQPRNIVYPPVRDIATGIGFAINKPWGLAPMLLFWLQPFFVCFGRVPVNPRDFARSPIVRITAGIEFAISSVRAGRRDAKAAAKAKKSGWPANPQRAAKKVVAARRRASYVAEISAGFGEFFDRSYTACPWCGQRSPSKLFTSPDMLLRKPGRFRYDSCDRCGHVFANPPLSPTGVEFYSRDCYDGLLGDAIDALRNNMAGIDRSRAELMRPFGVPAAWLDVGIGRGQFCNLARDVWPRAVFDGIVGPDIVGPDIVDRDNAGRGNAGRGNGGRGNGDRGNGDRGDGYEATRRGWADYAYQGSLAELVEQVAGCYDVISMFHYLQRVDDPHLELDAVAKVLDTGGHLVVELPNPDSPLARWLGRFWIGWSVPRHIHMISADNLVATLAERGFRAVSVQYGPAHQPRNFAGAAFCLAQSVMPVPFWPWAGKPPSPGRNLRWGLMLLMLTPLFATAATLDVVTAPWFRRGQRASAFRVVARKE